jgi:hypothetical protein
MRVHVYIETENVSFIRRKPEGKRPLGRPRCRWEDRRNIKIDLVLWWSVDWIDLAQDLDRWLTFSGHGNEFSGSIKGRELLD